MKPFVADPDFTLYVGDVLNVLAELPDESIHTCVTSPPYWGLRDYGTGTWEGGEPDCPHTYQPGGTGRSTLHEYDNGLTEETAAKKVTGYGHATYRDVCGKCQAVRVDRQLGLEATPAEYVENIVAVFREVRRVLRSDGTCWLNLGDTYANDAKWGGSTGGKHVAEIHGDTSIGRRKVVTGIKAKDLVGIPWRVAFALQEDGWHLRSDVIWAKPNPMPESVTDRPSKSHEYVFLLTKRGRYFYDVDAIREPHKYDGRKKTVHDHRTDNSHENYDHIGTGNERWPNGGRNKRTVWTIPTESYEGAHFATFPQALVEPCVKAGTSEHGCCPDCGAPWERVVETESSWADRKEAGATRGNVAREGLVGAGTQRGVHGDGVSHDVSAKSRETIGWQPTCKCAGIDLRLIRTPTGEGGAPDPTMETGRSGLNRLRNVNGVTRPITRYEQAGYAKQLRASPARNLMQTDAGGPDTFAHYIRTDESGARPAPHGLLEHWIERGWIERVEIPKVEAVKLVPAVVLDPFMGSGTTALVARRLGRHAVGIELKADHAEQAAQRLSQLSLFGEAAA